MLSYCGAYYNPLILIFQIFLKVAEESGVDAETSGNSPKGLHALWTVPLVGSLSHQGFAFPFKLFYDILTFTV